MVLHFDGSSWTEHVPVAGEPIDAIWAGASDDVYAVGRVGTLGTTGGSSRASAVRFDGSSWSDIRPADAPGLVSVWGAGGRRRVRARRDRRAVAVPSWELDLASTGRAVPRHRAARELVVGRLRRGRDLGARGGALPLRRLELGSRRGDGAAGGLRRRVGRRARQPAHRGQRPRLRARRGTGHGDSLRSSSSGQLRLQAIWGTGSGEIFAGGSVYEEIPGSPLRFTGSMWHFDGARWVEQRAEVSARAIHGTAPDDVFASATDTAHFDGRRWSFLSGLATTTDVWAASPSDVYFVRAGRVIHCAAAPLRRRGRLRRDERRGDARGLGRGAERRVRRGDDGVVMRFEGGAWSEMRRGGGRLTAVAGRSSTEVYAIGEDGTILAYDGTAWRPAQADLRRPGTATCPELSAIVNAGGAMVVVGDDDLIARQLP
ncbi:MAG: hypothetical protein M5U28_45050 [Sandaracinaceae bacterium]|nr:hypothetical protein [Sandaracinaceae bacterium]